MTLEEDILDYHSIVPSGIVPDPKPMSLSGLILNITRGLIGYARSSPVVEEPVRREYPNEVTIKFPNLPSTYELHGYDRPLIYFVNLLEAVLNRMNFNQGQERTYHLLFDPGSFGSFLSSLAHIAEVREGNLARSQAPGDIKHLLVEYSSRLLKPNGYQMMTAEISYVRDPTVTIKIKKIALAVP